MTILRSLQGMIFAAVAALLVTVSVSAQEHSVQQGTQQVEHSETVTQDSDDGAHDSGTLEGKHAESVHETGEHAEGAHSDGGHGTENLTPQQEMMRVLEHKVENTTYIHEYPFPQINLPQNWTINIAGYSLNMSPNRHLVYMWLSALITILLLWLAARQNRTGIIPRGYGNMIESMVVFVRDEIANPLLGRDAARYLPLLLTFFSFSRS